VSRRPTYKFRLYVADDTRNSVQARANLAELCRAHLPGRHEIEVVDVLKEPERALEDGILMTPTLIVLAPAPVRRIVGTLSQTGTVLRTLGLEAVVAA
jgi:circadian clock protein KaiB